MDSGMDRVYHWDTSQGLYAVRPSNVPGNASIPCAQPKYAKVTSTWRLHGKSLPNLGINQAHMLIEMRAWTQRERERERESWIWIRLYLYLLLFCYLACIRSHFDLSSLCIWCFLMAATPPQAEAFRRPVSCCVNWDSAVWHLPPGTLACQANPVIQIL
jgi:hypothetical protein